MTIHGSKKGSSKPRQPIIAPDSAQSKTYINILYGLGEGEISGLADGYKSVYLDDTPLQNDSGEFNFPNIKVDFRSGTNDQTYIDGFPDVSSETAVGVELKHGTPWVKALNNLDLDALRIRLKWGALRSQNAENGDVGGVKIEYAIDLKTDNGGWVQSLTTSINAKTSSNYERSHRIDLPPAQTGWQVRVRRITPNSTSDFVSDKMYVSAVTEVIDLKLRYPNTALLGLRYDAESFSNVAKMSARCRGLIIKVPTNYDPVARTYTGMWDGTFKRAYTNNPAWVYYDLCTAERYGLGGRLTESMIDKWSLYRLAQYCDEMVDDGMGRQEPRFTVNVYIQSAEGAFEILSKLAGVFRAISYWDGNSIVVDADIPQDSMYSFSRANVIGGVFEYSGTRARDRHTVAKVAWSNPANHFKTEYEYVRDEKAIAKFGVRVADISAWGCTSKGQAQRAGLWALKSEQLETRMVTFKVGLDGYIPTPAKVIEISDELFAGRATGGRVFAINKAKTIITLDRPITANVGDTLVINGDDGVSQRRLIKSINGDKVTVTKSFTNISVENVWVLDSADLATMKFRVLSVTADDNHQFTITAVQYNPAKYDAIDTGAYIDERPISVINPTVQAPTKSVNLSSYTQVNQGVTVTTLVISWEQVTGAVKYAVEWRKDNGNWQALPPTGTNSIEIAGVYAGQYEAKVTAISAFGQASLATHSNLTEIQGKQGKPTKLAKLTAQGVLFGMELGWLFGAKSEDTNYTEIQVSPDGRTNITALGTFAYPTNKHEITGLQGNLTQYYRARIVDKLGNTSDWTAWTSGTTENNAEKVLDLIGGQISESHLDQTLRTPIGKISTLESAVGAVNSNLGTLNSQLANTQNELNTAKNTLQTAVGNITTERNRINTAIRDITALQTANNAKTQEIANLIQTTNGHTSSIRELGVTTGDLNQQYSQLKTATDTANGEITAIKQTQSGQVTSIERLGARFDSLAVGGRNLLKNSSPSATNANYMHRFELTNAPSVGDEVVITLWGDMGADRTGIGVYNTQGYTELFKLAKIADGVYQGKGLWKLPLNGSTPRTPNDTHLNVYFYPNTATSQNRIDRIKLEKGNVATDWTPAPEDTQSQLDEKASTATLDEFKHTQAQKDTATASQISQLTANVSTAQNTANTANGKADTATTKADNAQNTANNALSRANTANTAITAEQKARADADSSLASQITALDTAYKSADSQLSGRITTAQNTATNAQNAVATARTELNARFNNLSVGGRNLILGSQVSRNTHGTTALSVSQNIDFGNITHLVLSCDVRFANAQRATTQGARWFRIGAEIRLVWADGTSNWYGAWQSNVANGASFDGRVVHKITVPTGKTLRAIDSVKIQIWDITGENMLVKNPKLELGTIATDWTPAPEDVQADIDTAKTETLANINTVRETLTNADIALGRRIDDVSAEFKQADNTIKASVQEEITARTNADAAIAQNVNALQSDYNNNKSSVASQIKTLSDKDKSTASQISQITANVTTAQQAADTANTKADDGIRRANNAQNKADTADAKATQAKADITAEQQARADGDGSLARQMSALDSKFTNADNQIKASVAQAQQTASNAQQAVAMAQSQMNARFDNLSVGGRNYLLNSASDRAVGGNTRYIMYHANLTELTQPSVFSAYVKDIQGNNGNKLTVAIADKNNVNATLEQRKDVPIIDGRVLVMFNAPSNPAKTSILVYANSGGWGGSATGLVIYYNAKLEIGTVATDYTPAPEDIQSELNTKASTATLDEFKQVQASQNEATAQRIAALDAAYKQADSNVIARLAREETTRASADTALTQRINSLQSTVNGNKASIDAQLRTLSEKDKAQAQKLSQLEANLGQKASAAALNNLTTKVNQVEGRLTAEASKYSTLQTTVGQHTASIQVMMQSVNGLKSQYTLKVESGGVVAGIGLASENGKSRFAIRADVLDVVSPDGTKRPMFSVLTRSQTINGVSVPKGVYLDNAYIARGSINMLHIADSIQSDNYVAGRSGWRLFKNGTIEINSTFGDGTKVQLTSRGLVGYYANGRKAFELGHFV